MHAFNDHFSARAPAYARYRPHYPAPLFDWLAEIAPSRALVLDCGTGSGQAANAFVRHFEHVVAADPSTSQLHSADHVEGVDYVAMRAEDIAIRDASVSLVAAAQALHWFDTSRFFAEAVRILAPHGVLAVWSYGLCQVDPGIDDIVSTFYRETLAGYWPPERVLVDEGYASLSMPLSTVVAPDFSMEHRWPLEHFLGYLATWSAVTRMTNATGQDPLSVIAPDLAAAWGSVERRVIRWPLALRAGRNI